MFAWLFLFTFATMIRYSEIIGKVREQTDRVILFHSGTGKDSIMLLDLLAKSFKEVKCIFLYFVKDLGYESRYVTWAEKKYPNCSFIKTPSPAVYKFIKSGYLGIQRDPKQTLMPLSKIDTLIRAQTGIKCSIYGFKKVDGLNRRLMLGTYEDGICHSTNKAYPLMDLKNSQVINYIKENNLIQPFNYNPLKPSSGCDISQPLFLSYIRQHYPQDLPKIFAQYPYTEITLFKHDKYTKQSPDRVKRGN